MGPRFPNNHRLFRNASTSSSGRYRAGCMCEPTTEIADVPKIYSPPMGGRIPCALSRAANRSRSPVSGPTPNHCRLVRLGKWNSVDIGLLQHAGDIASRRRPPDYSGTSTIAILRNMLKRRRFSASMHEPIRNKTDPGIMSVIPVSE